MVAKILVDRDIEAGRLLVEELNRCGALVTAAFWFYDTESERYLLYLTTTDYPREGPLKIYELVQSALQRLPAEKRLSLTDVKVVSPSDKTVFAIGQAIQTDHFISKDPPRLMRSFLGDVYVEDALIYRMISMPAHLGAKYP